MESRIAANGPEAVAKPEELGVGIESMPGELVRKEAEDAGQALVRQTADIHGGSVAATVWLRPLRHSCCPLTGFRRIAPCHKTGETPLARPRSDGLSSLRTIESSRG